MKARLSIICALAIVSSLTAFAGGGDSSKGQAPNKADNAVSWEEFQGRCAHPESFQNIQRAPQNISVQCTDTSSEYVPVAPKTIALAATRGMDTAVISDKFQVAPSHADWIVAGATGTCVQFQKIIKTTTASFNPSCDQIDGFKGTADDFCRASMDEMFAKGGAKVAVQEVKGDVIGNCPADTSVPPTGKDTGGKDTGGKDATGGK